MSVGPQQNLKSVSAARLQNKRYNKRNFQDRLLSTKNPTSILEMKHNSFNMSGDVGGKLRNISSTNYTGFYDQRSEANTYKG